MHRFPVVASLLLVLAACGGEPTPRPTPDRGTAFDLPETDRLAGKDLEVAQSGPWTVRRNVTAVPLPSEDGRGAPPARRLRGASHTGGGAYRGPGDAVPPGAREPSDATPPSPEPVFDDGGEATFEAAAGGPAAPRGPAKGDASPSRVPESEGARAPRLRAGSTDDNADYAAFLAFLAGWSDQEGVADRYQALDVSERRAVRVVDGAGRPVPGARVHVVDEVADRVAWSGTTYGDGRTPFYPYLASDDGQAPEGGWLVEVRLGDIDRLARWDGAGEELVVHLDAAPKVAEPVALDVGILLDTTGSMGDEMARIKATLLDVTTKLRGLGTEFDLRVGAVLYRDLGDEYVTMAHPFTSDVPAFADALRTLDADGGGDGPESLNQGLAEAVGRLAWRPGAAHLLFLIADAPPHMDYDGDVGYGTSALAALDRGIRVHAVAASGIDRLGTLVFRQVAQLTRGKFIFIEYGSPAASAASHGVTGSVKSNNLDDILFEQIQAEVAGWGQPDPK